MRLSDFLLAAANQTFWVLYEGGLFILLGFAVAGGVHVLLDPQRIVRHLGARSLKSATFAALMGAPLPLCSCGVLPTATLLRRKGASREATLSFLITTPETGVDSVAATLAFFGPLLALVRPIVAIATGLLAAFFSLRRWPPGAAEPSDPAPAEAIPTEDEVSLAGHVHAHDAENLAAPRPANQSRREHVRRSVGRAAHYAFIDLFDELGFSLTLAILLTGFLSALLPSDFFLRFFPTSFAAMVAMVLLSVPLYVCASASTPLAALFVAKGASAGAALVFLLVGPATNAATIATIARLLGRATLSVYLGSIIGVAVAAGLALDFLLPDLGRTISIGPPAGADFLSLPKIVAAIALALLLLASLRRTGLRTGFAEVSGNSRAAMRWARGLSLRSLLSSGPVQALGALWIVLGLARGFIGIPLGEQGLKQRLGVVEGSPIGPGLTYAVPLVDQVELVRVDEVRELPVGYRIVTGTLNRSPMVDESLYLTADENVIDLHAEVQYRVSDPVRYRFGVERPDDVITGLVRGRLVEAMASRPIDLVYTSQRTEVESWLGARVRADVEAIGLGVDLLAVRLLDVHAPSNVHDAFRDVASAHEDRLKTIHHASEYAVGVVALARGEAERITLGARADAATRTAEASGRANAFLALAAEHARAPELTEERLYIETAERTLAGVPKLIRPVPGELKGYELWLRRDGTTTLVPPPPKAASAPVPTPTPSRGAAATWTQWSPERAKKETQ